MSAERIAPSEVLRATRVVAVLRAQQASEYAPVVEALVAGGVLSVELTLSTRGVFDQLPRLRRQFGDAAELGVGTVTTAAEAQAALDAVASYLVTPVTEVSVIEIAQRRGVPVFPGGFTPTELHRGWAAGATAVKVFPASKLGPGYVSDLRGPFPDIQVIPSGGVGIADAAAWIEAGALAVSLGGPLVGDAFPGGDLRKVTERAAQVRRVVDEAAAS